ncbi:DivIVA domain-containing protein [Actinomyces trachealis]|uniref:DivIVA domain-containing protein n=1 Tax=Actinomyces trachealis TaxID=2763540 RepID=UPI0039A56B54
MSQDMFPRTKFRRLGYRPEQVDGYFTTAHEIYEAGELEEMDSEGVRTVAFSVVPGGYDPVAVDSALDRLEAAFLQRRRADFVAEHGRKAWMDRVAQLATTLYPRLLRPAGKRFAPARGKGYLVSEVDDFMDRVAAYFDSAASLSSAEARTITFRAGRGNKAYDEKSVDRYLARVVEVLLSVE